MISTVPRIPSVSRCLALMDQYGMLANIRAHSFMVARVAETIVSHLADGGGESSPPPDRNMVIAGALLHDIAKTLCLDGSCKHAEEGRRICESHGYGEVGGVVAEHVVLSEFAFEQYKRGRFGPKEIVFYADKRVKHDTIVTLDDRLGYIIARYSDGTPATETRIKENFAACLELESYLFSYLPFATHQLVTNLTAHHFG
jgi:uncharacterized protein